MDWFYQLINLSPVVSQWVTGICTGWVILSLICTSVIKLGRIIASETEGTGDDEFVNKFERVYNNLKKVPIIGIIMKLADRLSLVKDIS